MTTESWLLEKIRGGEHPETLPAELLTSEVTVLHPRLMGLKFESSRDVAASCGQLNGLMLGTLCQKSFHFSVVFFSLHNGKQSKP